MERLSNGDGIIRNFAPDMTSNFSWSLTKPRLTISSLFGIGITGSYCTYKKVFEELRRLADTQANLFTIFSDNASSTDSRFGKCKDFLKLAEEISGKPPITTIPDAENGVYDLKKTKNNKHPILSDLLLNTM